MPVYLRTWYLKGKTGISILNLTAHGATIDLKSRPVFTDLKIQACKTFQALVTGMTTG